MPNHSIGNEEFEFWEPAPPKLVTQTVESFSRPGVDGVGQQLAGIRGKQFEAICTAHFPSYIQALDRTGIYRALIGTGLFTVIYNNVNFFTGWQTKYSIDDYETVDCYTALVTGPSGSGNSYYYPSGGVVVARFLMTPHKIVV